MPSVTNELSHRSQQNRQTKNQKRLESGGRQRRTAAAGDRQQMVVFAGGSECLVLELG
jgi:hypothetical protein